MRFSNFIFLSVTLCAVFGLAPQAKADLVPVYDASLSSGDSYVYDLNFVDAVDPGTGQATERLDGSGALQGFATIYDIPGFISATVTGPFTVTSQSVGITPPLVLPTDTGLTNVTATYTGSPLLGDTAYVGILTIDSASGGITHIGQYTSQQTKNTGPAEGTGIEAIGRVDVPGRGAPTTTPEPATFGLLGSALLGFGALKLGRRSA